MKTSVLLFKSGPEWTLARFRGATIPCMTFPTATAARRYAASRLWAVRRAPDCDDTNP